MVVDGAGVRINRIIGSYQLDHIDPFVLLDEIKSDNPEDYIAGFPTHPHRGIETITYMVRGNFRHKDSRGSGGVITDGCVQWMTAGKGILHSEMPEKTKGLLDIHKPELIVLGKSMMIYREPLKELSQMVAGMRPKPIILYDMAHVLGLAGPYYQEPFKEGADIVTSSTHKTFFC
jgi:hypothetical protein